MRGMEESVPPSTFLPLERRRAVLVGIEYTGTSLELGRSVGDVAAMRELIRRKFEFDDGDIMVLCDAPNPALQQTGTLMPTKRTIVDMLKWLVIGAKEGDSLLFYYAGHGVQVADENGDELDGMDEALVPVDFDSAGALLDDEIHALTVRKLPKGARLTAVVDASHSGSVMDLLYVYDPLGAGGVLRDKPLRVVPPVTPSNAVDATVQLASSGVDAVVGMGSSMLRGAPLDAIQIGKWFVHKRLKPLKKFVTRKDGDDDVDDASCGEVLLFSACKDWETASSSCVTTPGSDGTTIGAMTQAFLDTLSEHDWQHHTFASLLYSLRDKMEERGYSQVPQLSSSHKFSLNSRFLL